MVFIPAANMNTTGHIIDRIHTPCSMSVSDISCHVIPCHFFHTVDSNAIVIRTIHAVDKEKSETAFTTSSLNVRLSIIP